jgi:signal transduction histidine kinase
MSLLLFAAAFVAEKATRKHNNNYAGIAAIAGERLKERGARCEHYLEEVVAKIRDSSGGFTFPESVRPPGSVDHWFSVFVYENDSLVWWSDDGILPDEIYSVSGIRFIRNGWYDVRVVTKGNHTVAGLLRIKNQYAFQNRFLSNEYHPSLGIPQTAGIYEDPVQGSYPVFTGGKSPAFYLKFQESDPDNSCSPWIALVYIVSYLLFVISVYMVALWWRKSDLQAGLITLITVIVTRYLSLQLGFPESIYAQPLFSPSYYASSFLLNSLGDLLLSTLLITYLVRVFYRVVTSSLAGYVASRTPGVFTVSVIIVLFFAFLYSVFVNYLVAGLIINSRISFNINNVFELNAYSLLGVVIIGILLYSFYLVCDGGVRFILRSRMGSRQLLLLFCITQFAFLVTLSTLREHEFFANYGASTFLLTNFLIIYSGFIRKNIRSMYAGTRYLLLIMGFSIYAAQNIASFNNQRERSSRKVMAAKLENEQDHVAEYLFDDIADKLEGDKAIADFFAAPYEEQINSVARQDLVAERMTQLYFTGYWGRYDITIRAFNSEGLPLNTGGDPTWNLDYFNIVIREDGLPTYSPYLYYTGNVSGRITYIGRIPLTSAVDRKTQTGTIVVNLVSKPLQGTDGFPELLISDKIPQKKDISSYSYAYYRDKVLVNQFGKYNYLVNSEPYLKLLASGFAEQFVTFDGYSHLFYRTSGPGMLIVSIRNPGILEFVTLFSYLFTFYCFSFGLLYLIWILWNTRGVVSINFKNRIQVTVITIVITTMLLVGGATVYYIYRTNYNNMSVDVNDRLKTMLVSIRDQLDDRTLSETDLTDEMNYTFSRLAATLGIDFNIYSGRGMLVYSTQPKIFDQYLRSAAMNRVAMDAMLTENKSLHIQYEEVGRLSYLSAYEPVLSASNAVIGFINLPYFSRQDELKKEISSFLVTLINIYVLLFAFSVFITFVISGRITEPLQLIQQRLGKIRLGMRNELIEWDRDDEIGGLVREYNRMVEELAESADRLARSERESAWREMAKQVAHEIKNPLTPMKLGVQHLHRAWREKSPNLDTIMQQVTQTLVEQIDTLSNIATEFSNFAKMPRAVNEKVDLSAVVRSAVALYGENEHATITCYEHPPQGITVYADREHLMRVFSNLLKNAIQAIPEGTKGHIHVEMKREANHVSVSVRDNGVGISEDAAARIFTPNFTTKTGGMGLGLAMVKNMVEQAGGTVGFSSRTGEGTTFTVVLPLYEAGEHENAHNV